VIASGMEFLRSSPTPRVFNERASFELPRGGLGRASSPSRILRTSSSLLSPEVLSNRSLHRRDRPSGIAATKSLPSPSASIVVRDEEAGRAESLLSAAKQTLPRATAIEAEQERAVNDLETQMLRAADRRRVAAPP
jgi:hypothetical protein